MTNELDPHPKRVTAAAKLSSAITAVTRATASVTDELLTAIGAAQFVGVWPAAALFFTRIAMLYSTERTQRRIVEAIKEVKRLDAIRTFASDDDLLEVLGRVEDYLQATEENKASILRRVVLRGLIPSQSNIREERDFRCAIRAIEAEDVDLLRKMAEVVAKNHRYKKQHPNTSVQILGGFGRSFNPEVVFAEQLKDLDEPSLGRLQATMLIWLDPGWSKPAWQLSEFGTKFLQYLAQLPG